MSFRVIAEINFMACLIMYIIQISNPMKCTNLSTKANLKIFIELPALRGTSLTLIRFSKTSMLHQK